MSSVIFKLKAVGCFLMIAYGSQASAQSSALMALLPNGPPSAWIEDPQLSKVFNTFSPAKLTNLEVDVGGGSLDCRHQLSTNTWVSLKIPTISGNDTLAVTQISNSTRFQLKAKHTGLHNLGLFEVTLPRAELTRASYRQMEWALRACAREITAKQAALLAK